MVYALVIAGGVGARTKQHVPKQFLTVFDKPIIIYTLESLQKIKCVDKIVVSCLDGWQDFVRGYAMQYGISKLEQIVTAGSKRFYSILNGVSYIQKTDSASDDIVVIIDANRPLIPEQVFLEVIEKTKKFSAVLAVLPSFDSLFTVHEQQADKTVDRNTVFRGMAPEAFRLSKLEQICVLSEEKGLTDISTSSAAIELHEPVSIVQATAQCFKITTADDIEIFKALVLANGKQ